MTKSSRESFSRPVDNPLADVLLFHGLTAKPSELEFLASRLRENGFRTHCPCLAGHDKTIYDLKKVPSRVWIDQARSSLEQVFDETKRPVFVAGLSFGALLSIVAAGNSSRTPEAIALMSTPLRLASKNRRVLLSILSSFPDSILNLLWTVKKKQRDKSSFKLPRDAYKRHSVAAAARLVQVRQEAFLALEKISCPMLALQDPGDHHLDPGAIDLFEDFYSGDDLLVKLVPGGQHELTLGPKNEEVVDSIVSFFKSNLV